MFALTKPDIFPLFLRVIVKKFFLRTKVIPSMCSRGSLCSGSYGFSSHISFYTLVSHCFPYPDWAICSFPLYCYFFLLDFAHTIFPFACKIFLSLSPVQLLLPFRFSFQMPPSLGNHSNFPKPGRVCLYKLLLLPAITPLILFITVCWVAYWVTYPPLPPWSVSSLSTETGDCHSHPCISMSHMYLTHSKSPSTFVEWIKEWMR